jgi:hypothetical protein
MKAERDWVGALVGLAVFLVGVAGLVVTFYSAFSEFSSPPGRSLGIVEGQTINVNRTANLGYALLSRITMLIMMCIVSSVIANRGIKLYAHRFGLVRNEPKGAIPATETPPEV